MPRDNFNSQRKSLALEVLTILSNYYELPGVYDSCLILFKSKKKEQIFSAIEFQENYVENREVPLEKEIIEILDKIVVQTKDRSVAVSALNIQVETGHIDEFEALSRIDEWKEKNDYC